MIILVAHSLIVSAGVVKLFELSIHPAHPLVEYATAVLADGVAVSLILQVIVHA